MADNRNPELVPRRRPPVRARAELARAIAGASIVITTLAVAAPSWAGPVMGC